MASSWLQPLHAPTVEAFDTLNRVPGFDRSGRFVLDSGCGTGESTRLIAHSNPDCTVIGVDKSEARLARLGSGRFPHREGNAIWLRAELSTFWRLALAAGWRLQAHYLLYPNPWPKPGQLSRRWHAHPVFPTLLALGGRLEMRCNWEIYAREFALALRIATGRSALLSTVRPSTVTSPFEKKYRDSGHGLFRVVARLDPGEV
jgi:tRNA G46 methylase TrmB